MYKSPISTTANLDSFRLRRTGLVVAALVAMLSLLMLTVAPTEAKENSRRGLSGTVMSIDSTSLRVAIKTGLETVFVDSDTKIKRGREKISLSDIKPGDRISARVNSLAEDQLLATKIKVRGKASGKKIEHLTGVVTERHEGKFSLATRDGKTVEVEVEDGEEVPEVAEVITTIVEKDSKTGRLEAKQIERVERIVQRLERSLSKQIDKAKAAVLRKIIDESARQHLDTLNQTLDEVDAEAKVKIEAALTKFRTDYAAVAERVGNAPPEESYEGVISEIFSSTVTVSSTTGSGARMFGISADTVISIEGTANASTVDLLAGQSVVVRFVPAIDGSGADPVALAIEALPPALPPIVADAIQDLSNGIVQGDITVVTVDAATGSDVIIINENGTGDTIGIDVTPDTVITVDGQSGVADQLAPAQQVEVAVASDGVTAESVVVTTTAPSPAAQSISGIVSGNDPARGVIVITPASGNPLRLEVLANAVITLDGAAVTLSEIQPLDIVLDTSLYLPDPATVTRLSVARPAASTLPDPGATGTTTGGQTQQPGAATVQTFSISGLLKSTDGDSFLFEGMTLPKSSGLLLPVGVVVGSTVDLVFTVAADGSLVLTAIQAP